MIEAINNIDFKILNFILDNLHNAFLDAVMPIITMLGDGGWFWIVVAVALLCTKKYRKYGVAAIIALAIGVIVGNGILKNVIARPRPYEGLDITLLVKKPWDWSFPSGHTQASFAVASVLMFMNKKKIGIPAIILAAMIGFSRIYLYVHYPSDVIGGMLLGIMWGIIGVAIVNKIKYFNGPDTPIVQPINDTMTVTDDDEIFDNIPVQEAKKVEN